MFLPRFNSILVSKTIMIFKEATKETQIRIHAYHGKGIPLSDLP
jgi:hypothetical protein